ncbi:hypothetical protein T492DRAFT_865953 [Pavlovales sp. CCMP2436]|nr:hypothetical protein T492DRAFT_865953 [Pavlovales sp. CCMP2436]
MRELKARNSGEEPGEIPSITKSGHGGSRDGSGRKRKPEALPVVSKSNPWIIAGGSTSALNDNIGAISAGGSAERTAGGVSEGVGDSFERAAGGAGEGAGGSALIEREPAAGGASHGHKGALHTQEWEDAERCVLARPVDYSPTAGRVSLDRTGFTSAECEVAVRLGHLFTGCTALLSRGDAAAYQRAAELLRDVQKELKSVNPIVQDLLSVATTAGLLDWQMVCEGHKDNIIAKDGHIYWAHLGAP